MVAVATVICRKPVCSRVGNSDVALWNWISCSASTGVLKPDLAGDQSFYARRAQKIISYERIADNDNESFIQLLKIGGNRQSVVL